MKYSIIIPVYNDRVLPKCLASLAKLTGNLEHEIVVVENGTTDWIKPLVEEFGFQYVFESVLGSYTARNAGIAASTGDILVFTDSDCEVAPNWLEQIGQTMADPSIAAVMGFSAGAPSTRVAALEQLMYEANIAAFTQQPDYLRRVDTRNLALRRTVLDHIGQFNPELKYGGDMEFGARMHAAGFRIVYQPTMLLVHHNIKQFKGLLLKRVRQNYGNMLITQLHERAFVTNYFPHLFRYQANFATTVRYYLYALALKPQIWFGEYWLRWLPIKSGYWYFKAVNVLAMRLGQMIFILRKPIW